MDALRGVIDRFEGTLAVIVLDDAQQLLWPRASLPTFAQPGMAVRLCLVPVPPSGDPEEIRLPESTPPAGTAADLPVKARYEAASDRWELTLANGSILNWPAESALCETAQLALLRLVVDIEDTAARRKRVQSLLDDLFGNSGT
ncbi:MAG: hypothetical protein DDG58_07220 [Ardenticatenia bacterium]|jgi:hypothetical protein|nr:MAG: hypothetical protein DDG58_07220 [Ardenticatenia bacterium]